MTLRKETQNEPRKGPRPLALHLMTAANVSTSSLAAWTQLRNGWTPWSKNLAPAGNALQKDLAKADPETFSAALLEELGRRHTRFLDGLEKYRAHSYRRRLEAPPPLWQAGTTQLLDYGTTAPEGENGRPLLVIPSLINRSHIMDLTEKHSFLRFLAKNGFRPLLVDWGVPKGNDLDRSLDDYIAGDLVGALDIAVEVAGGRPVPVLGYCMGGTLAAALAVLRPDQTAALLLLAAPWDFHVGTGGPPPGIAAARPMLENLMDTLGYLPVDALQAMFLSIDPLQGWTKFQAFADAPPASAAAETFVALEDWLNDGVPLAAKVARSCLFGWYGENQPARGQWSVGDTMIVPGDIACPTLGVLPAQDRIVPPASAQVLIDEIPDAISLAPNAGHIGMMMGGKARTELWTPLSAWLSDL